MSSDVLALFCRIQMEKRSKVCVLHLSKEEALFSTGLDYRFEQGDILSISDYQVTLTVTIRTY